jgi:hypothetical protein
VRFALEWGRDGDLLVLLAHESREAVLAGLERLAAADWRPGEALPADVL